MIGSYQMFSLMQNPIEIAGSLKVLGGVEPDYIHQSRGR